MTEKPSISVVMATYNGEKYVAAQFESIANQTLQPFELIVSDDGSTDQTLEVLAKISKNTSFPVVITKNTNNLGFGENFLSAAFRATGQYIAFCDQDDIWNSDKLEVCMTELLNNKAELCVHAATVIDKDSNLVGRFSNGIRRKNVYLPMTFPLPPWRTYYGCTMVFATKLLTLFPSSERGLCYFDSNKSIAHDGWVYFLASNFGRIVTLDQPLIAYRRHGTNYTPLLLSEMSVFSSRIGDAASEKLRRTEIADYWAQLIKDHADYPCDLARSGLIERSSQHWKKIGLLEKMRIDMYSQSSVYKRARVFADLIFNGCYRKPKHGGFGLGLILKDLVVGFLRLRPVKV